MVLIIPYEFPTQYPVPPRSGQSPVPSSLFVISQYPITNSLFVVSMTSYRTFEDLELYKAAREFRKAIYILLNAAGWRNSISRAR